jgi:hypothetical protein
MTPHCIRRLSVPGRGVHAACACDEARAFEPASGPGPVRRLKRDESRAPAAESRAAHGARSARRGIRRNLRAHKDVWIFTPTFVLVLELARSRTRTRTRTRTIGGAASDSWSRFMRKSERRGLTLQNRGAVLPAPISAAAAGIQRSFSTREAPPPRRRLGLASSIGGANRRSRGGCRCVCNRTRQRCGLR